MVKKKVSLVLAPSFYASEDNETKCPPLSSDLCECNVRPTTRNLIYGENLSHDPDSSLSAGKRLDDVTETNDRFYLDWEVQDENWNEEGEKISTSSGIKTKICTKIK